MSELTSRVGRQIRSDSVSISGFVWTQPDIQKLHFFSSVNYALMRKKSTEDSIEQSQIQPSTQRPIKKSKTVKRKLRPSLFFFRLASNAFPDVGSVGLGRSDWKKNS